MQIPACHLDYHIRICRGEAQFHTFTTGSSGGSHVHFHLRLFQVIILTEIMTIFLIRRPFIGWPTVLVKILLL